MSRKWREKLKDFIKVMNFLEVSVILLEFEFFFVLKLVKFLFYFFYLEFRKVVWEVIVFFDVFRKENFLCS